MRGVTAAWAAATGLMLGVAVPVQAQAPAPAPLIYTCTNAAGKKLTSDRPIPECSDRAQRVLNTDGSERRVIGPVLTAEQRAEKERAEREAEAERVAQREAVRSDRNLLARFPNEAAHAKGRAAALDIVHNALKVSEARLAVLARERTPLTNEAEFYVGKPLPSALKTQLDANDAAVAAQRELIQNQKVEVTRIDQVWDAQLARLKRLWAGAEPGSMGPVAAAKPATSTAKK